MACAEFDGFSPKPHREAEGASGAPKSGPDENMNSRVSWSIEGIDPSVRERTEAAARRAGMSLNDWLKSTIGNAAPPNFCTSTEQRFRAASQENQDVTDIHQRLDSITRQIEQISRQVPHNDVSRSEQNVARQLNDAFSRLDARLSRISNPTQATQAKFQDDQRQADMVERAASQSCRPSSPFSPTSLDRAIMEIAARQNELDGVASTPGATATPAAPVGPDFSTLERHLFKITNQIDALRQPDWIEQSIAVFRGELTEIRHAITEAMPRGAIESIENEIRSLSRRIDDTRQSGIDAQALAGIERALGEIREVLRSLTPAEQLVGYDEAIRNLGTKLDLILRANDDHSTVQQLEGAIAALRAIVSNVASNDALARLSDDVYTLSSKVDQLVRSGSNNDSFAILEQRIAALTLKLENRERSVASESSEHLENALRALSDRLDRMPVGNDSASALGHLEQRVSYLLERLESSADYRAGNFGRIEDGLQDILRHLEVQHANLAALAESKRSTDVLPDRGLIDIVERELSDIRLNQSETDRHTQDSFEALHNTLGHVVDRLAIIEGDLRAVRIVPVAPSFDTLGVPQATPQQTDAAPRLAMASQPKPELPNPAAGQEHFEQFVSAARKFSDVPPAMPVIAPTAIREIVVPKVAQPRSAIEPDLPPDHPLEPGTRPTGRTALPSEPITASESAISEITVGTCEKPSTSSFIAAARRAAQAAAAMGSSGDKSARSPLKAAADKVREPFTITSKIRSLLVGASVIVTVLGTITIAMTLIDGSSPQQMPVTEYLSEPPSSRLPAEEEATPARPDAAPPSMILPMPIGRQSFNRSTPIADSAASAAILQRAPVGATSLESSSDVTGTIPVMQTAPASRKLSLVQVPPNERLPDGIGGPVLRAAALKGDPAAAYEIGVRFAEGKGVASNFDEAAKWYDRAAQAGVVSAIFRLGTFYEKGLSVKKDTDTARRYYLQAAEQGNAKAMHNLAVLDADGGGKGANYKGASHWFRKAAERGVADSQFNLGILYARGIGVEKNMAESFKWFSLAAAQGDTDAARKCDDIAKRLDPQSLAAAKLAIQTFTPEPQPDDASNVAAPAGGWDNVPAPTATAKPVARLISTKRASVAR